MGSWPGHLSGCGFLPEVTPIQKAARLLPRWQVAPTEVSPDVSVAPVTSRARRKAQSRPGPRSWSWSWGPTAREQARMRTLEEGALYSAGACVRSFPASS